MTKLAMVINKELPGGLIANTAAVLGISVGNLYGEIVGADILDGDGKVHRGITRKTIPVLAGTRLQIKGIRDKLYGPEYEDIYAVDFSDVAQKSLHYEHYQEIMESMPEAELEYLGICLYGPEKKVNSLTGYLGLLR